MVIIDFPGAPLRAFADPADILIARSLDEVTHVIAEAEAAARRGLYAAGWISYEAAPAFDPVLTVRTGSRMPLVWFGLFDRISEIPETTSDKLGTISWDLPVRDSFIAAVDRVREEIAAGSTYQVNLTARLTADVRNDARHWYETLRRAQGAGYHAYFDTAANAIASASPELFFERRGSRIRTKPMKGTCARGRFAAEDVSAALELATSEKDRAENLMIVDLLRNDLGRIANVGSVEVTSLFDVEHYHTVHQMTSVIEADIADSITLLDVFEALFPCGSVTGAPKVSTMKLITELEASPREVYCGAIGLIEPGGDAVFSVAIRTLWIDKAAGRGVYGTGAGITYDSDPHDEYEEIIAKAAVLTEEWPDFELIETFRMENGVLVRVDRHIERMLVSARYFGIAASEAQIRTELAKCLGPGLARVRVSVDQRGVARVDVFPLDDAEPGRIAVATTPVDSRDRFLFHKTTHRRAYESRLDGHWDVLLWNERGEMTEFTRGNVVLELDGQLVTPPVECGLLAGTFRAELLEEERIRERVLYLEDLRRATSVWLINSLRGWVDVDAEAIVPVLRH